ncbi:transposase [Ktedonosporobacter rubrisoli]|uniref:Transposase n=1 Tax=Ktedonosporobacter rubrisoli TaxID=2509675 RepID=A0A4P6JYU5_KTERU|nr:zinc ribbon domain-containing protein [Ktedonosporobacter rubrisoli]QBD80236.1 transposase [Ktedonosporobacter rubrisoli]
MGTQQLKQSLSYPLRLPDDAQVEALRLLDLSREATNHLITVLWPRLDEFIVRSNKYAYKQIEAMMVSSQTHGSRQFRCEAEQAGRVLRAQAKRKQQFALIQPILTQGMIMPKSESARPRKHSPTIKQALEALTQSDADGGNYVELRSLIEQACNFSLKNGSFPDTYEEMQPIPLMQAAQLPYAGDDGATMGQAYRMAVDLKQKQIRLSLRTPDAQGNWGRGWRDRQIRLPIPDYVVAKMEQGSTQAPVLREIKEPDGTRYAVLDLIVEVLVEEEPEPPEMNTILGFDWGVRTLLTMSVIDLEGHQLTRPFFLGTGCFDGEQARTRQQIDQLKAAVARQEAHLSRLKEGDARREVCQRKLKRWRREISLCWKKYENRNHDLAHLAANVLLLLAAVTGCSLIVGESLKSMKSQGRGRDTKGRWRNWRNNTQVRGEIWRVLKYKCFMTGMHLEWQQPRATSHTCPRCGKPAQTYTSSEHLGKVIAWGAWLWCHHCGWSGSRDYAASLNIARLGAAWLKEAQRQKRLMRIHHPQIQENHVNPVCYMLAGSPLRFPARSPRACLHDAAKMYINGWTHSVTLHSSYPTAIMLDACG